MASHPYVRWTQRLSEMATEADRRALMSEVALHRARSLGNLIEVREATWALSQLHAAVGEHDKAVLEARSLLSLAGGTPPASDEEVTAARGWLSSLGVEDTTRARLGPRQSDRSRRGKGRKKGSDREARRGGAVQLKAARKAGKEGRFSEGLDSLEGKEGTPAESLRAWLLLRQARAASGEERVDLLEDLEGYLAERAGLSSGAEPSDAAPRQEQPSAQGEGDWVEDDGPLGALLGGRLPRKRSAMIRTVEAHADAHPEQIDALASAALRHHVQRSGERRVAPWWIGLVARALSGNEQEETRQALSDLAGAYAVTAYSEDGFRFLLEVGRSAVARGWAVRDVRRGVLKKAVEGDVRLWTLTLVDGEGCVRTLVHGPTSEGDAMEAGRVDQLFTRGVSLSPVVGFQLLGSGHAALRTRASEAGRGGWEAMEVGPLLDALAALEPRAHKERKRSPKGALGQALESLKSVLSTEGELDEGALTEAVSSIRRRREVCRVVRESVPDLTDERMLKIGQVCLSVWSEAARLPELTTLLTAAAAKGGQGCRALLTHEDHAKQIGGAGIGTLTELGQAAGASGWEVVRVLAGLTRRERESEPAFASAASALEGLWRCELRKGDVRGDIWFVETWSNEGGETLLKMLKKPGQRKVVLPSGGPALAWYEATDAPQALAWSGAEAADLCASLDGWTVASERDA